MSNSLPYYLRYSRDFMEGKAGLGFETKTTNAFLLDPIYLYSGPLPDIPQMIVGQLKCSVRKWNLIRVTLVKKGKIAVRDGVIVSLLQHRQRPPVPAAMKREVIERDGKSCRYCGREDWPFEFDHLIPFTQVCRHNFENLTIACRLCNRSKAAKPVKTWLMGGKIER